MKATSLRTKFLFILLIGAVLPLAVVGWWLTGTAVRSGRALLRRQLDAAIASIATGAHAQWTQRAGELQLLANNSVVQTALSTPATRLAPADSQYLVELFTEFRGAIPLVTVADATGRVRWSFVDTTSIPSAGLTHDRLPSRSTADSASAMRASADYRLLFPVEIAIQSEDGRIIGVLRARVRLSSVLATDSARHVVPGALFAVLDERGVLFSSAPDSLNFAVPTAYPSWEIVMHAVEAAPLRLALAGPAAPFVQPFEHAANVGLSVLMGVALIALLVSAVLTNRVTGSIKRMVLAAEAVAAGDLHGKVVVSGKDEIGRLADAFNVMTASLRRTIAELSQQRALAAVGEFAASLSHEVRNSLTAVRIDLQHATRQLPVESMAAPLVKRTLETVRRLDATVTGALRVARSGQAHMSRVDLADLLRRAMASAAPSFAASEATLEPLAMETSHVDVHGDAGALEQLFLNLLLNAAQAVHAGGRASVEVRLQEQRVVVGITDNGPGFATVAPSADMSILHSTKAEGTGLGLPIARRIAQAHGGELRIESASGKGTTVSVVLPSGQQQSAAAES